MDFFFDKRGFMGNLFLQGSVAIRGWSMRGTSCFGGFMYLWVTYFCWCSVAICGWSMRGTSCFGFMYYCFALPPPFRFLCVTNLQPLSP